MLRKLLVVSAIMYVFMFMSLITLFPTHDIVWAAQAAALMSVLIFPATCSIAGDW